MSDQTTRPRQNSWRAENSQFVVSVDHQIKCSFETREAAEAEASRIKQNFPAVTVAVGDSTVALISETVEP